MYTESTLTEKLKGFISENIHTIIKKTKQLKPNIDYYIKDLIDVYQQVDIHGNQRYIVSVFIYDVKNFYTLKILVDFVLIMDDLYVNYIGEDFSSNDNILNTYDYTMSNRGYLEWYNQINNNI